jgi:hypothetical protein
VTETGGRSEPSDPGPEGPAATPPKLLSEAIGSGETPSPLREATDLAVLHQHWAALHEPARPEGHASLKAALTARRWVASAAAAEATQEALRGLIGDLIRAVEALAIRCDELGTRVSGLERALTEVVEVLGEDLVAVRAQLAPGPAPTRPAGGADG